MSSNQQPKVVCIVGVAGFIGSHLLEKIIRDYDWHVIGIDMVPPHKIKQLLGAEKRWASRFEFIQMNIVHKGAALGECIARSDVVVNLAAICNPSEYIKQPVNTINSNFSDAQECINYCVEHKKFLIHFSTCEVPGHAPRALRCMRCIGCTACACHDDHHGRARTRRRALHTRAHRCTAARSPRTACRATTSATSSSTRSPAR